MANFTLYDAAVSYVEPKNTHRKYKLNEDKLLHRSLRVSGVAQILSTSTVVSTEAVKSPAFYKLMIR